MDNSVCEKVDISRIVIQRVHGMPWKARVSSIEAANRVLDNWAGRTSDSGDEQCDVRIVFEDGFRYQGHYQLSKSDKRSSLARHVRKQLKELATKTHNAKSSKTDEKPVISLIGADLAESARIALDHYNI
ncbi:MAG: hypothetical protein V4632_17325 [Pseudomonadota bacterium]